MDSLLIEGKYYISARRASAEQGYTTDYIGQLIRAHKLVGKKVGRAWYVEVESLEVYAKSLGMPSEIAMAVTSEIKETPAPIAPKIKIEEATPIVSVTAEIEKKPYKDLLVRSNQTEDTAMETSLDDIFSMRYLRDDEPTIPEIVERKEEYDIPIHTIHHDLEGHKLQTTHHVEVAVAAGEPRYEIPARRARRGGNKALRSVVTVSFVLLLIGGVVGSTFLYRTFNFDGSTVTAGVAFSDFGKEVVINILNNLVYSR